MKFSMAIAAAILSLSSPALAQLAPGYSGYSSAPRNASEAEYWRMIARLGPCLASQKREASLALLSAIPGSKEENDAASALLHRSRNRCMGNFVQASMLRAHIRGSIAEGLFERWSKAGRRLDEPLSAPENITNLRHFARCYISTHSQTAIAFLKDTKLGSEGELEAVRQMAGDFAPCFPTGAKVNVNPINIRMAIAEALFHAIPQAERGKL